MKRPAFIAVGIIIIILIIGMWVYLLLYGAPKESREVFTNLGIINETSEEVRTVAIQEANGEVTKLALEGGALQQLTMRTVAGFAFSSSTPHLIRYVEKGTGHIYQIDTNKSVEEQISVVTIPQTNEAVFSEDATAVAITAYEGYDKEAMVGALPSDVSKRAFTKLPLNAENLAFESSTTLNFTLEKDAKTIGYNYNLATKKQTELFSLGFTDVVMHWGSAVQKHYAQSKPAATQKGFLYSVEKSVLTALPQTGSGLSAFMNDTSVVATYIENEFYRSFITTGTATLQQPIPMFKEKCAFAPEGLWCAAPLEPVAETYLEDWYKGAISSVDYIWFVRNGSQSATLKADLQKLSGRNIDVQNLQIAPNGSTLLFVNKNDQSLWLYKIGQ